ncbi:molybdenum cofactor cytidylyltransferase [Larkinella arboricola]|uniref:Molybdenum cofactor cytidylyltransferase n=1 Tax=Larkinella arboricola TaxID=643671 RepID=A0A327X354_LARAB|nr:nucleotidyltransferase family protein [Larkinella arboricola]RAK00005.1 molybdenum cofactor cytidylyltransferase [Larkinella arboricola]
MNIAIIILAAGSSSRMDHQPKQLIQWEGRTLLRRVVDTALDTTFRPVVVVLGAHKKQIASELDGLPVTIIDNQHWQQGLATSVKTGLAAVYLTQKDIDAVLFLLTDQPHVDSGLLQQLVQVYQESGKGIVAASYAGSLGVPALFDRKYIHELLSLEGDAGAKKVIMNHPDDCVDVHFALGSIDLDTRQDVAHFLGPQSGDQ